MQTTTVQSVGTVVLGKVASIVFKMVDFDADFTLMYQTVLDEVRNGKSVGITPRMPVNKKANILEVEMLVNEFNTILSEGVGNEMEVRTVKLVQEEIAELKANMVGLEVDFRNGKINHSVKVNMFNKMDHAIQELSKEMVVLHAEEIKNDIKDASLMTQEERNLAENLVRWAKRKSDTKLIDTAHRASDIDYSKYAVNAAFKTVSDGIEYFKDQMLLNRESFQVVVTDVRSWNKDKNDRVGSITVKIPRHMMQIKQWDAGLGKFAEFPLECYTYNAFVPKDQRAQLSPACLVYHQYFASINNLNNLQAKHPEVRSFLIESKVDWVENALAFLTFDEWLDNMAVEIASAERALVSATIKVEKEYTDEEGNVSDETAKAIALGSLSFTVPAFSVLWFYLGGVMAEEFVLSPADITRVKDETADFGSTYMLLEIKEDFVREGGAFVRIPKTRSEKNGVITYPDIFLTRNIRFNFYNGNNNANLGAALTAFIRVLWSELVLAEPANRFGFNEHCGNCAHKVDLRVHDQMGVEYKDMANAVDTSELGQWGERMPQWVCGIKKELMDASTINDVNEATSFEGLTYTDEEGVQRYPRDGYVIIKGKPVSLFTLRAQGTTEEAARCSFYSKNDAKPQKRYEKEVRTAVETYVKNGGVAEFNADGTHDLRKMKIFVNKYWTDRAQANRQAVFVKHMDGVATWELGYPGEFKPSTVEEFSIQGLGGINVFGTPHVIAMMDKDFLPTTEAYKAEEAQIAKLIDITYNVCFQFDRLKEGTLDTLFAMIDAVEVPAEGHRMFKRYNDAMDYLVKTIEENQ